MTPVTFARITRVADLPPHQRVLSDTAGLSPKEIRDRKLVALGDDVRERIVLVEHDAQGAIVLLTDLEDPDHDATVSHTLALIRRHYPGREIVGYAVPKAFVSGIYSHTIDHVSYDTKDDQVWVTIDEVFSSALALRASDIYVLGGRSTATVEFLIHGFRVLHRHFPMTLGDSMARALYRSAHPDAQDRNFMPMSAQETSFERHVDGELVRFRYQHIPVEGGWDVCLRILRLTEASNKIDFARLGFLPAQIEQLERIATAPKGLVITVGATGSGKSTTNKGLIESYDRFHGGQRNIREVSNPVEYAIENVRSTNVVTHANGSADDHAHAFTTALRAIVRMNPHAVLVGEIRDRETAVLTVEMARTGHKVFTSCHADTWVELYPRLRRWTDQDPGLYASHFVIGIIAQELLPTVCPRCAVPLTARTEAAYVLLRNRLRDADLERAQAVQTTGPGCSNCEHGIPGIAGRIVIATMFFPTREVLDALRDERYDDALSLWTSSTQAPLAGYTLHDHALEHIWSGRVDPLLVERAIGALRLSPRVRLQAVPS